MQSQIPSEKGQIVSSDEESSNYEEINSEDDEKKFQQFQQLEDDQNKDQYNQERFQSIYYDQEPKLVEEYDLEPLVEENYEEKKSINRTSLPSKLENQPLSNDETKQQKQQEQQFKEQKQQQEQKQKQQQQSQIPNSINQSLRLINDTNLLEENEYILIESYENFRLMQHETQKSKYKAFLTLSFPFETVAQLFLEVHRIKHWNPLIEEFKVIKIIDQKQAIIYEKHKSQGYFYYKRDYIYNRSIFQNNKSNICIVDTNSQQYSNSVQKKWNTRRGTIKNQIIVLKSHPTLKGYTLLSITSNIDHNNKWFTTYQDQQFILNYLKAYQNIETFLIQQSFLKDSYKYFTLDIISNSNDKNQIKLNKNLNESAFFSKYGQNNQQEIIQLKQLLEKLQGNQLQQSEFQVNRNTEKEEEYIGEQGKYFSEVEKYDKKIDLILEKDDDQDLEQSPEKFLEKNSQKRWDSNQVQYMLDLITTGEATKKSIRHNYQLEQIQPSEPILQQNINGEHYAIPDSIWEINSKGGLVYVDQEGLKNQKKVIKLLVKQMGKNLLSGKSVINISMPVVVFSDSSVLGRLAECFVFAPNFFEKVTSIVFSFFIKAGTLTNPLDQFKQVIAFNIAVLHFGIEQTKPFNPILGETFQAFINGAPLYMEQICHHPPISALQVYAKNYYMDGKWELAANMHTNSLTGKQIGLGHIKFYNNQTEIYFSRPATEISGLLWGQRLFNYAGKSIIYDIENQLYCEIIFNTNKEASIFSKSHNPIDYFQGTIYKVKKSFVQQLYELSKQYKNIDKMHALFKPKEHIIDILHEVSGIWHKYLLIDDEKVWDFYQDIPHMILHENHPLPSDSIYRKDLIMWQSRNYETAQAAKEELENIQRADRKFRAKYAEKNKKHK